MNGHFQIRLIIPVLKYLIEFRKKPFDRSCVWAISGRIDRTGMCVTQEALLKLLRMIQLLHDMGSSQQAKYQLDKFHLKV